jgi:hypothetical protein
MYAFRAISPNTEKRHNLIGAPPRDHVTLFESFGGEDDASGFSRQNRYTPRRRAENTAPTVEISPHPF